MLMDYLDAVLHVFARAARAYRLETLWGEAGHLDLDLSGATAPRSATRPLHFGAKGEARSDLCGAAARGRVQ